MTTATDGRLALWDATSVINQFVASYKFGKVQGFFKLPSPFYHYQAHLSGVNAVDIREREGKLIVNSEH